MEQQPQPHQQSAQSPPQSRPQQGQSHPPSAQSRPQSAQTHSPSAQTHSPSAQTHSPSAQSPQQSAQSHPQSAQQTQEQLSEDFRHIVRIANTDLEGKKTLHMGLCKIKGINFMFSNLVCRLSGVDKLKRVGDLTDKDVAAIHAVLENPFSKGAPSWMFNRRKDMETGEDKHLLSSDLAFAKDNDLKLLKKMRSYRGVRHMLGQPSRGQRTKSHFRKNKGKVSLGVKKRPDAKSGKT
ncbi:30S ribosomal protein S13 [Candidatus Woesearchaeota archaeon]|nr:30S ribosomal protein S13 [Candidatus Woesearchaeota archaeon]